MELRLMMHASPRMNPRAIRKRGMQTGLEVGLADGQVARPAEIACARMLH